MLNDSFSFFNHNFPYYCSGTVLGTDTWDLIDEIPYVSSILCFVFCTTRSEQGANMATRRGTESCSRIERMRGALEGLIEGENISKKEKQNG